MKRTFVTAAIRYHKSMDMLAAGTKASVTKFHVLRAALVVVAVILLTLLETNVSVLSKGLAGTPYLLLVAFAALWGDYWVGALSVVISTVGLDYAIPPAGMNMNDMAAFKLLEFLMAAVLICAFTWKLRAAQRSNIDLATAVAHLQTRIKYLQSMHKGNKKKLAELSRMNHDLEALVDQFLQDEHYWQAQMEQSASKIKLKSASQASSKHLR